MDGANQVVRNEYSFNRGLWIFFTVLLYLLYTIPLYFFGWFWEMAFIVLFMNPPALFLDPWFILASPIPLIGFFFASLWSLKDVIQNKEPGRGLAIFVTISPLLIALAIISLLMSEAILFGAMIIVFSVIAIMMVKERMLIPALLVVALALFYLLLFLYR